MLGAYPSGSERRSNGKYGFKGSSEFTVAVPPDDRGIQLRRRCDQQIGRQRAKVFADGTLVKERTWHYAACNPYKRWLDDEFDIPTAHTKGKDRLRLKIDVSTDAAAEWNEYCYWVFS